MPMVIHEVQDPSTYAIFSARRGASHPIEKIQVKFQR